MKRFVTRRLRLFKVLLCILATSILSDSARAHWIDSVTVLPDGTITPSDPVTLEVLITTPNTPAWLYQYTEVVVTGYEISVDIFPDSGPFTALDSLLESVDLGTLQPGQYEYVVALYPWDGKSGGTQSVNETFTVVPEPATLLLLAAGTLVFARRHPPAA